MADFPCSLIEFQRRFAEGACASYLADARWPDGFRCPDCGHPKGWELATKAFTWECAGCGKQTSVTAGTVMHGSKLPLTVWFWAAYLMATHSNGIAALQLQKQLGLGSYKSAWLLCGKLRRATVAPDRAPLCGLVEIDETTIPFRTKADPPEGGQGRSADAKMLVAVAVEVHDGGPGRLRLAPIADFSAASLHAFIKTNVAAGATAKTDGWSGYPGAPGVTHDPHVIGPMAAHIVLPFKPEATFVQIAQLTIPAKSQKGVFRQVDIYYHSVWAPAITGTPSEAQRSSVQGRPSTLVPMHETHP